MSALAHIHKSEVKPGDCILHNGKPRTVCSADITRCEFFGLKLFGDSYRLGYQLVIKIDPKDRSYDGK